mgnify:CR=1 FL=1
MTRLQSILSESCPNCQKGKVFSSKGSIFRFQFPTMKEKCKHCHYTFEKEPGYFFGAMYISYGLCMLECIMLFILTRPFIDTIFDIRVLITTILALLLLSFYNFRLSRIIWMNIFTKSPNK